MAKITLTPIASGYNLSQINANFVLLADALNNDVLYRLNPVGEPNALSNDIDLNNYNLLNVDTTNTRILRINGVSVVPTGTLSVSADAVDVTPAGTITSTNVQAAIEELDEDIVVVQNNLNSHLNDTSEAHVASAIGLTPVGSIASNNVQSAIAELDTEKQPKDASLTALAGTMTAANKIPYATAPDTAGELDFKDEDNMASNSAIAVPSQQSTKAYVDNSVGLSKLQSVTIRPDGANTLLVRIHPTKLTFRNTDVFSGVGVNVDIPSNIDMIISAGSTLGTVSGRKSRLAILAINNAGTAEVAITNLDGGLNLDESGLITTVAEGGTGTADSANVIYSTTARTNVAYRVVGFADFTQAIAGDWVSYSTNVQGMGGNTCTSLQSIGYRKPIDVSSSRVIGTTYYNTTGRPFRVYVGARSTVAAALSLDIDGVTVESTYQSAAATTTSVGGIIPPGSSYAVSISAGTPTLLRWFEQG